MLRSNLRYFKIVAVGILCFDLCGCGLIAKHGGREAGDAIKGVFIRPQFRTTLLKIFEDQPSWDREQLDNEYSRVINKAKDQEFGYIVVQYFLEAKITNFLYYREIGKFYPTQKELYAQTQKDVVGIYKYDPWGNEYYYEVAGEKDFIMGTPGPNRKWNVKIDDTFKDKLKYGTINSFGDDLFIKIRYPGKI